MIWFLLLLAVAVIGLAAVASTGRLGQMPPVVDDRPLPHYSGEPLTPQDVDAVRFAVVPRGYSMSQVDDLLDDVAARLGGTGASDPAVDLGDVRFTVGYRGYSMSQVDDLLDRITAQLAAADRGPDSPATTGPIDGETQAALPSGIMGGELRVDDEKRNHDGSDEATDR